MSLFRFFLIGIACLASHSLIAEELPSTVEAWISTSAQRKSLASGEAVMIASDKSIGPTTEKAQPSTAAIVIPASAKEIWDVLQDEESAADYLDTLIDVKVLEKTGDHSIISQKVKVGVHEVDYIVKSIPSPPDSIVFSLHSGDLQEMAGFWKLIPLGGEEETLLIYRIALKPNFPVPRIMIKNSLSKTLPETLRSLRGEVLRRKRLALRE
ncbi:MAG: SRPBCC family protein [Verrucomicrobiota bacterium]